MPVTIQGLSLNRLIVHEVLLQGDIEGGTKAQRSDEIMELEDVNAVAALGKRLHDALGSESHAVDLDVQVDKPGSAFDDLSKMLDDDDSAFIAHSKSLADALTRAQSVGSIKPGVVVLLDGELGPAAARRRFIAVIKAESDAGFLKAKGEHGLVLRFVRDLVLSAQQRLFKIGFFVEIAKGKAKAGEVRSKEDFEVIVYDHQMSVQGRSNAARYFYATFLGCGLADNVARLNRVFFETATDFFKDSKLKLTVEERLEKRTHLVSYMKNQLGKISGKEFAELALKPEHRDPFLKKLKTAGFPDRAVVKDTTQIARRLTLRRLTFSSENGLVRISAPEDNFSDLVKVVDATDGWTTLQVKGRLEEQ